MRERERLLLPIAGDELVLGWRNSSGRESPRSRGGRRLLVDRAERDRPRAGALRARRAEEVGGTADELAFDRSPPEYRHSRLVELRLVPDWARTLARHVLYEAADAERLPTRRRRTMATCRPGGEDRPEELRLHAQMWQHRLAGEPRFAEALDELRPLLEERGRPGGEFGALWEEMTMVRRSVAGATW